MRFPCEYQYLFLFKVHRTKNQNTTYYNLLYIDSAFKVL